MNKRWITIFWGIVLILAGIWTLGNSLGYLEQPPALVWMAVFAGLSIFFFLSYFVSGVKNWGWLFPATITAALAITIFLGDTGRADESIASLILGSVAVPFLVAFSLDRAKNWWALIPAWILLVVIGIVEIASGGTGELVATLVMYAIALPFLAVYLTNRSRKWALIPFYILAVVGLIPLLASRAAGEWVAALVLFATAIPFLAAYLRDRTRKWALIPAIALMAIGLIPPMTRQVSDEWIGAFVNLLIALPFLVVYFLSPAAWWALIPAGIMGTIAIVVGLIALLGDPTETTGRIIGGALFLGWGLTFGILWLRRNHITTDWAKYPALGLGAFSLAILIFGERMNDYWPILIIIAGVFILYINWRERRSH
jgi:hypothetical protein